jgi:hypothetical protein
MYRRRRNPEDDLAVVDLARQLARDWAIKLSNPVRQRIGEFAAALFVQAGYRAALPTVEIMISKHFDDTVQQLVEIKYADFMPKAERQLALTRQVTPEPASSVREVEEGPSLEQMARDEEKAFEQLKAMADEEIARYLSEARS